MSEYTKIFVYMLSRIGSVLAAKENKSVTILMTVYGTKFYGTK